MDIREHYGLSDLRHLISEPFPGHRNLPPPQLPHRGLFLVRGASGDQVEDVVLSTPPNRLSESPPLLPPPRPLERQGGMNFLPGFREEGGDGSGGAASAAAAACGGNGSGSGRGVFSHGRWPRQETLILLEIRSRLDPKFKGAAQKAPLWDKVARIMAEEHGYHRSGRKCKEKLENLYKYYKKMEGKAGRHDGKRYRFFRQLEALYGENANHPTNINVSEYPVFQMLTEPSSALSNQETLPSLKHCENLSFLSSSEFDSWPSEGEVNGKDDDDSNVGAIVVGDPARETRSYGRGVKTKRGRKSWKSKVREFIDLQLKRFMAVQEAWLEKMLASLEHKEQERMSREEEWRKQETARFELEHKLWARERALIEARDAALIEALEKLSGRELKSSGSPEDTASMDVCDDSYAHQIEDHYGVLEVTAANRRWPDEEVTCLIQLRTGMEARFQEGACLNSTLWEEISAKMGALGYEVDARRCKEKWENINKYFRKSKQCNKNRKENSTTCPWYKHAVSLNSQDGDVNCYREKHVVGDVAAAVAVDPRVADVASPSNSSVDAATHESCFPFMMDGVGLWEASGLDAGGDDQQ